MKTYAYTVNIHPAEEGGYWADVPALPGCVSQGETYDEVIAMIEDAIHCYLDGLIQDGQPIPDETPHADRQVVLHVSVPQAV